MSISKISFELLEMYHRRLYPQATADIETIKKYFNLESEDNISIQQFLIQVNETFIKIKFFYNL